MDEAHRATLPGMNAAAHQLSLELREAAETGPGAEEQRPRLVGRRRLLAAGGGVAAALALAACGDDDGDKAESSPTESATGKASRYTGDLKVVALAAALENQAVEAYQAALKAAEAGKLGKVPPAVATFIQTAMSQHEDHAEAWNSVLSKAGKPTIQGVPLSNRGEVTKALGQVKDVPGVARLALTLEDQATQTYTFAAANVKSAQGIATAATIAPVEAMHAAILHFVLGQYPVPDDFVSTSKAAKPSLLTV
ncbi:ferritin-like domain-containing protein [Streptomyces sp. NA04227]|nr:ferritin-like domain-containing protein [Streptomyces sp. NA04227]